MSIKRLTAVSFLVPFLLVGCGTKSLVSKGDMHLAENRPDSAAQYYQKALDKDPNHTQALRGIAASHLQKNQPVRAIIPAQRATRAGDRDSLLLLSQALLWTGRADEALTKIRKGMEHLPIDPHYNRLLVEALIASGQYKDAALTADEILLDSAEIEDRLIHTWALLRSGRLDDAVAMAAESAAMATNDGSAQALCAYVFWIGQRKGDFDRAHKMARALLPATPSDALRSAADLAAEGHKEGAIFLLASTRAAYPTSGPVAAQLGMLFAERTAWPESIRELTAALNLPPYASAATVSGVQKMKSGDTLVESQRRREAKDVANQLAEAFAAVGQYGKAAQAWTVAVEHSQKPSAADLLVVANAWEKAGNVDEMGRAAQQASTLDPSSAAAHHVLAKAFDGSGNTEWAIRHARKSWELDPEQAEVVILLGGLYEARGERRVAKELYRDALRRHPSDARIYAAFERVGGSRRK